MSLETNVLSKVLFGLQRQSSRYQNEICKLTAKLMVENNCVSAAELGDEAFVVNGLSRFRDDAIHHKIHVPRALLCLLIGLDNYSIVAADTTGELTVKMERLAPVSDTVHMKYSISVERGIQREKRALTYHEIVERLIDAWKPNAPEFLENDLQRAMYMMIRHIEPAHFNNYTPDTVPERLKKDIFEWANNAPRSLQSEGLSQDECAIYAFAIAYRMDMQRIDEMVKYNSCNKCVRDFLANIDYNTDAVQQTLFGKQTQGDGLIVTLTALTCKLLIACGLRLPDSDASAICSTVIASAIKTQFDTTRKGVDPLIDVLTSGTASEMREECITNIIVIAEQSGENGRYTFKCIPSADDEEEYE